LTNFKVTMMSDRDTTDYSKTGEASGFEPESVDNSAHGRSLRLLKAALKVYPTALGPSATRFLIQRVCHCGPRVPMPTSQTHLKMTAYGVATISTISVQLSAVGSGASHLLAGATHQQLLLCLLHLILFALMLGLGQLAYAQYWHMRWQKPLARTRLPEKTVRLAQGSEVVRDYLAQANSLYGQLYVFDHYVATRIFAAEHEEYIAHQKLLAQRALAEVSTWGFEEQAARMDSSEHNII
jgi:hypothetical protein